MSISIDLNQLISILTTLVQAFSSVSGLIKEYSSTIIAALPANTVLWFTLTSYLAAGWGLCSLGSKICKYGTIICLALFLLFLSMDLLHL